MNPLDQLPKTKDGVTIGPYDRVYKWYIHSRIGLFNPYSTSPDQNKECFEQRLKEFPPPPEDVENIKKAFSNNYYITHHELLWLSMGFNEVGILSASSRDYGFFPVSECYSTKELALSEKEHYNHFWEIQEDRLNLNIILYKKE